MKNLFLLPLITLAIFSCEQMAKASNQTDSDSTNTAEETTTSFLDGMSEGIYDKYNCSIEAENEEKFNDVSFGKYKLSSTDSAKNNVLSVYCVFSSAVDTVVKVEVFDLEGTKYSNSQFTLTGGILDPKYIDIEFSKDIELKQQSTFKFE